MSVHVVTEHQVAYFTCDNLSGKPEHRSLCRAAQSVRPEQGGLWMDPADVVPDGWTRAGGAHMCPEHEGSTSVASLVWSSSSENPTTAT